MKYQTRKRLLAHNWELLGEVFMLKTHIENLTRLIGDLNRGIERQSLEADVFRREAQQARKLQREFYDRAVKAEQALEAYG